LGEATTYCTDLTVENISSWHLPTISEITGLSSIYSKYENSFTIISIESYWSTSIDTGNGGNIYGIITSGGTGSVYDNRNARKVICVKNRP
jgi:hypothetical protein